MNSKCEELRLVGVICQLARRATVTVVGEISASALRTLSESGFRVAVSDGAEPSDERGTVVLLDRNLGFEPAPHTRDAELVVVLSADPAVVSRQEDRLRASGFRTHPRQFRYRSFTTENGEWPIFIAERHEASGAGLLSTPISEAGPSLHRISFATFFARPGDRAAVVGGETDAMEVVRACTTCSVSPAYHDKTDFVLYDPSEFDEKRLSEEARKASALLTPGGRFVSVLPILGPQGAANRAITTIRGEGLGIEKVFVQGNTPRYFHDVTGVDSAAGEWCVIVSSVDPVEAKDRYGFEDTIYPFPNPTENLLAFDRDYENPWLMRSTFGMSVRTEDRNARLRTARLVESGSTRIDADRGSAICLLGYDLLSSGATEEKTAFLKNARDYLQGTAETPHALRWQVSVSFLCGVMLQAMNLTDDAVEMYRRTIELPWIEFSPTLGTKAAEASYRAGMILYRNGDTHGARAFWKSGVEVARTILGSSFSEVVGDAECPLPDALPETIQALALARKSADCLRITHASHPGHSPYHLHALWSADPSATLAARVADLEDENRVLRERLSSSRSRPDHSLCRKIATFVRRAFRLDL